MPEADDERRLIASVKMSESSKPSHEVKKSHIRHGAPPGAHPATKYLCL